MAPLDEFVKISVIIVTYNNRATIRACLESIRQQSVRHEVIIIDNASPDGTAAFLREDPIEFRWDDDQWRFHYDDKSAAPIIGCCTYSTAA